MSLDVEVPAMSSPPPLVRLAWAPIPRVNLLPPEVVEARSFRRLQRQLAGVVAAVVLLGAAAGVWAQQGVLSAQSDLNDTQAATTQLQQQQAKFAEVPKALAELDSARVAREGAMSTDVLWYRFLGDLALNTPANTDLSSVAITMTGSTSGSASGSGTGSGVGTAASAGLGQVTVTGNATRFRDVAAWLDAVTLVHGLASPSLQSAAQSQSGGGAAAASAMPVTYSGSAVVTTAALSHRFDRKAG
jgi:Tfp pilus assembly protein PilN